MIFLPMESLVLGYWCSQNDLGLNPDDKKTWGSKSTTKVTHCRDFIGQINTVLQWVCRLITITAKQQQKQWEMRLKISYFFSNFAGEIDVTDPLLHSADNRCDLSFSTLLSLKSRCLFIDTLQFLRALFSFIIKC